MDWQANCRSGGMNGTMNHEMDETYNFRRTQDVFNCEEVSLVVVGEPIAQPRPRAVSIAGHARVYGSGRSRPWKICVIDSAIVNQAAGLRLTGPLGVKVEYRFRRPKNHFGTGKNANKLKANAPHFVTRKPDLDNLNKSTFDALSEADVWTDDSIVAVLDGCMKRYCDPGEVPGCTITIWRLED